MASTLVLIAVLISRVPALCGHRSHTLYTYTNSEEEETALIEFRKLVNPDADDSLAYREFMKSDGYLVRWLMQTDFDVELALANFHKSVEWRRAKRVDFLVFEDFSPLLNSDSGVTLRLGDSHDRDGRPVVWQPLGVQDTRRITIAGHQELYHRFAILTYELSELILHEQRLKGEPNITQEVMITDLAGFNLKTGGCLKCVQMTPEAIANFDPNYPRLVYRAFLINAPKLFYHALNIAKTFLSAKSTQSVRAYGHDKSEWEVALHEQIPIDQLPVEYGGSMPTWRGKVAREDQRRKLDALVTKAKEAVRRELTTTAHTHCRSRSEASTAKPTPSDSESRLKVPCSFCIWTWAALALSNQFIIMFPAKT